MAKSFRHFFMFPNQKKLFKTRDLELPFSGDLSQVASHTPRDTPVPLYTRTSPCAMKISFRTESLKFSIFQDHGKVGLSLRGVAFMTVLAVLTVSAVLESTLPSFCLSYK